jgi:uncharacterized BrkB/YihY/UPF0761 family membrane protein
MVDWIRSYNAGSSGCHCVTESSVASIALGRHWWSFACRFGTDVGRFQLLIVSLPMISMSWYLLYAPPHAKQLKRVRWTLVGGAVATACWMAIIL